MTHSAQTTTIYDRHPKMTLLCVLLVLFSAVEVCSGLVIRASHELTGTPKRISVFRPHPLWTGQNIVQYESNWQELFPVMGYINRIHVSDECSFTTDRYGFIHNGDKDRTLSSDKFTIFLVGGSTVVGHGSSCNDQTISAHLENLFRESGRDVAVINAGVSGYDSSQEFLRVANEILFYDPDVVITFDGTNDFRRHYREYAGRDHTYYISDYHRDLYGTLRNTRKLGWSLRNLLYNIVKFTEYTYTRFLLEQGLRFVLAGDGRDAPEPDWHGIDEKFSDEMDANVEYYTTYVRHIQSVVEGDGAKHYHFLQPIIYLEPDEHSEEEKNLLNLARIENFRKSGVDQLKRSQYFWTRSDSILKHTSLNYENLTDVFLQTPHVYSDSVHYTDHGNRLIAERIFQRLRQDNL